MTEGKSKIVEELKRKVLEETMKSAVAMSIIVDKYFTLNYGKDFLALLLERPIEAYRNLIEYFGSVESADFYTYLVLKPIFSHKVDEALTYLKHGDKEGFRRLLENTIKHCLT